MPTSKTSLDFKLIAVRVLPGCVQHILKCLVENHFYYLNNDYRISEDGKLITRRSVSILLPLHPESRKSKLVNGC